MYTVYIHIHVMYVSTCVRRSGGYQSATAALCRGGELDLLAQHAQFPIENRKSILVNGYPVRVYAALCGCVRACVRNNVRICVRAYVHIPMRSL